MHKPAHVLAIFAALAALAAGAARGSAGITITEIQASNGSTLRDEDQEYHDWIELYNEGVSAVPLAGWSLTDDPLLPRKWTFPAVTLGSRAYLVVYASAKDRRPTSGRLHTNFKLNAEGEYLALFDAAFTDQPVAAFAPEFPEQRRDCSYGYTSGGELRYFLAPTPGAANGGATALGIVADPAFTPERGVYDEALSVEIATATPGATIYYRADPQGRATTTESGTLYANPIAVGGLPGRGVIILRAIAYLDGYVPSNVVASTYIFPDQVLTQPTDPVGFPAQWETTRDGDYELDPRVVDDPEYRAAMLSAIRSAPTLSLLADIDDLFDPRRGIYVNAEQEGLAWERPVSAEFIYPNGRQGRQLNCAIRIQGGTSTSNYKSPKFSFRLLFKDDYGPAKLRFPLFPDSPVRQFNTIVLDAHLNLTWTHPDAGQQRPAQYVRDTFVSDLQNALGSHGPHDIFANLYLNGVHWGMYDVHERPDDSFAASTFGGFEEDYDVLKHNASPENIVSGTVAGWNQMFSFARGGLASFDRYEELEDMLDIDDLIDYMIVNLYVGNTDWAHQNWYASRNRVLPEGRWRFHSWDAEHTLKSATENVMTGNDQGPKELFQLLRDNPEFRLRFADRAQRHFFNGAPLYVNPDDPDWDTDYPQNNRPAERYMKRIEEIDSLIVIESARWGDCRRPSNPYTKDVEWMAERNRLLQGYFPGRSATVLGQFRSNGLYPTVGAPILSKHGGDIVPGSRLSISMPEGTTGTVYVTTDGSDPRVYGSGAVSPAAAAYGGELVLNDTTCIKARVRSAGGQWSALTEAQFTMPAPLDSLRLTEIMYHPPLAGDLDGDLFEFIELKNAGTAAIDLTGVAFTRGIFFSFPEGTLLQPHEFAVLVANQAAFALRYPGVTPTGVYGGNLDNDWDTITLMDGADNVLVNLTYGDSGWWPREADGGGHSLVPAGSAGDGDLSNPSRWRRSLALLGTPGADDSATPPRAPTILRQPEGATKHPGDVAVLSVIVDAHPPPTYAWLRDGAAISGATGATYRTPPLTLADDGARFRCVVSNTAGSAESDDAVISVVEPDAPFVRGDINLDGAIQISDAVTVLSMLFAGVPSTNCMDTADVNDSGRVDIADAVALLGYLFGRSGPLPPPFPSCGLDPTQDPMKCTLYPPCQ